MLRNIHKSKSNSLRNVGGGAAKKLFFTILLILIAAGSVYLCAEHFFVKAYNYSHSKIVYPAYNEPLYALPSFAADDSVETTAQAAIGTSAKSAILIDADSRSIIYSSNEKQRLPIASTTKIATAITALESGVPLDQKIKITKNMTGAEGSSIYLYENEIFTLRDLLYALMLNSANDAAEAIAISIGGSVEKFAAMMNQTAAKLGLKDTNFTNPHGLDDEMHYTTAYDLAVITAYALENPEFTELSSTQKYIIYPKNPDGSDNKEGARFLTNHNKLLRLYEGCVGVKTGFTKRSGRSLVSAAVRDGVKLVAVTIDDPNDWLDHKNLLDYGFRGYKNITVCEAGEYSFALNIVNGVRYIPGENGKTISEKIEKIECTNSTQIKVTLPSDIDPAKIEYSAELPYFAYAPIKSGDIVGRVRFEYMGKVLGYSDITALETAELQIHKSLIDKLKDFFSK